jgi:electron transport complex protein RnfE
MSSPARDDFVRGVWRENPVLVTTLGMCPTLAVTNTVANCIAMGLATMLVLIASCALVALFAKKIPNEIRITAYVLIIATFVTLADMAIEALAPDVHKALGAFIALIVVNCIILGRQEAFASKHSVTRASADAFGSGIGFTLALLMMGSIREVIGNGTFLGHRVFGASYEPWVVMMLPPGGFLTLGTILLVIKWRRVKTRDAVKAAAVAATGATTGAAQPAVAAAGRAV